MGNNSRLRRKLIILVTISVFLLFFLKTQISWETEKSNLTGDPPDEEYQPEIPVNQAVDLNNKINVNEQQDRIQAEKFEANAIEDNFGEGLDENDAGRKDKEIAEKKDEQVVPPLAPPININMKEGEIVKKAKIPLEDVKKNKNNGEAENSQKKKLDVIDTLDEKLKANENIQGN